MFYKALDSIVRKLTFLFVVITMLSVIVFALARVVPGDPARLTLGPAATPEQVAHLRAVLGLNDPLPVQYAHYVISALHGDLGQSLVTTRPVTADIAELLPATLELVFWAVVLIAIVGLPLGIATAHYRDRFVDHLGRLVSLAGVTIPSFVFALVMQLVVANLFPNWPILGRLDHTLDWQGGPTGLLLLDSAIAGRGDVFLNAVKHLALPAFALSLAGIGQIVRVTRSAMLANAGGDHVLALRSFGVPQRTILFRYLLRLSSVAPLTILGLEFAFLIGNDFVIEMIFSWGGFASYGLTAIMQKDLNAVMAVVLVTGIGFVLANAVVDVLIAIIDPRIRLRGAS